MAEGCKENIATALLEARLWVGRLGESDVHRWWRTDGVLGPDGAYVGPRVLPVTHGTGRARIVFAVARHASDERYPTPEVRHLFRVDPLIEDQLDELLVEKLAEREYWAELMAGLERLDDGADTRSVLLKAGVVTDAEVSLVDALDLGPASRSLPVPATGDVMQNVRRLAAGFIRSRAGELAVPYLTGGTEA